MVHILEVALLVFVVASHALAALAQILKDLGKVVPGWLGTAIVWSGKAVDLINGQLPKPAAVEAPKA